MTRRLARPRVALLLALLPIAFPLGVGASSNPVSRAAPALAVTDLRSDIRVTLGRILGEHAFLTMEVMRAEATQGPELPAVRGALEDNSMDLAGAVGSVYGDDVGGQFLELWQEHIDLLVRYARATAAGDSGGAAEIAEALEAYAERLAETLVSLNPELAADDETAALRLHVEQLLAFTDSDYARAYAAERQAFEHMFRFGDTFARAIIKQFPDRFEDSRVVFSPAADLRLRLDRLLGEHLLLAAEAMQTGLVGGEAAAAASEVLDANSADLAAIVGQVYGQQASTAFGDLWRSHTSLYIEHIAAVARDDPAAIAATLEGLRAYAPKVGDFLAAANPALDPDAVSELIRQHAEALISQVKAFDAGDYPRAYSTVRQAYAHMFEVGDALAAAIASQFPDRFADMADLPGTATVGQEDRRWRTEAVVGLVLLGLGLAVRLVRGGPRHVV